jgi:carboxypeptidase family protein
MKPIRAVLVPLIAGTALVAACAGGGSVPGSPTPTPAPSVTAITVTGQAPSGFTVQLTAIARLSDGTTRDVTAVSEWSSSNESVIRVSPTGLATIVGLGSADVRAAYQQVVGSMAVQFGSGFALSGRVQEEAPDSPPVAGVRVEIVGGPYAGTAVTSDTSGAFRFVNLTGVVDVQATRAGYLSWRLANLTVDHDTIIDVTMYATPPTNGAGDAATARCRDGTWTWARAVADACSTNGGILYGVCPGALCEATRSAGAIR